jgi:amphi-Trp domain-containing protein
MSKDNGQSFTAVTYCDQETLAGYLKDLASGLQGGKLRIAGAKGSIDVVCPDQVKLTMEARSRGDSGKGSLVLDISWKGGAEQSLTIGELEATSANGSEPSATAPVAAYCMSCREQRTMVDPQPSTLKNGRPALRGTCNVCGSKVMRIGSTARA